MTKKKKLIINQNVSSPSASPNMNTTLELDNKALRAKNSQLVQTVAKLQQEKAQQQNQISSLQEEYFKLNSKFMNLRNIFSTIDSATKQWLSKYVELSEMCTKIMQLCNVGLTVTNLNKDTRTQAVKPQIVNGHILHNPTINLSRLSDVNRTPSPRRHSIQRNNRLENLSKPSTSRVNQEEEEEEEEDGESDNDEYDNENHLLQEPRFYSRRPVLSSTLVPLHLENLQQEDSAELDMENGEEPQEDEDDNNYCSRLITIQEEEEEADDEYSERSLNSSKIFAERVREVRIYIDPLPKDCLKLSRSSNSNKQSISIMSNNSLKQDGSKSRISPKKKNKSSKNESDYFRNSTTFEEDTANNADISGIDLNNKMQTFIPTPEYSRKLSVIASVPSCSTPYMQASCSNYDSPDNSKEDIMRSLGLEPRLRLTTSTPLSERKSKRKRKFVIYSDDDDSLTPRLRLSNVTKRRVGSKDKVAQVVLKRLSLEKKLSGSPIKKIGEVLNSSVITRVSDIKRRSDSGRVSDIIKRRSESGRFLAIQRRSASGHLPKEEPINGNLKDSEDHVYQSSPENNHKKSPNKDKQISIPLRKVQNRFFVLSPQRKLRVSPRPKRAARPTAPLKELSLRKKLRRSK